tara:strand:- start:28 stop:420 length:393 start_codon:yes stop_codon:yes gene_type:complete
MAKPNILNVTKQRANKRKAQYDSPQNTVMTGLDKRRKDNKTSAVRERLKNQYQLRGLSSKLNKRMIMEEVPVSQRKVRLAALRKANNTIQNASARLTNITGLKLQTKIKKDLAKAFNNKSGRVPAYLKDK